jgi:hypothetical protein
MKRHIQTFSKLIRVFLLIGVLISTTLVMSGCIGSQASSQGSNPPPNQVDSHDSYEGSNPPPNQVDSHDSYEGSNPPPNQVDSHDSYDSHDNHDHHPICIFNFGQCG